MRNLKCKFKIPKPKTRIKTLVNRISGSFIPKKYKKEKHKKKMEDFNDY